MSNIDKCINGGLNNEYRFSVYSNDPADGLDNTISYEKEGDSVIKPLAETQGMDLVYFGARYYDPEIGVWLSHDPAGQFNNPYGYGGNGCNPVVYVDPNGEIFGFLIAVGIVSVVTMAVDYLDKRINQDKSHKEAVKETGVYIGYDSRVHEDVKEFLEDDNGGKVEPTFTGTISESSDEDIELENDPFPELSGSTQSDHQMNTQLNWNPNWAEAMSGPEATFSGTNFTFLGDAYSAVSGHFSRGALPEGVYTATNPRRRTKQGMVDPCGFGWSVDLSNKRGRKTLRIHPDQVPYGTRGCIGIQGCTKLLYEELNRYFQQNRSFLLWVDYDM